MKIECRKCGVESEIKPKRQGNGKIEVALWLTASAPVALIYSLWRREKKSYPCPICQSEDTKVHFTKEEIEAIQEYNKRKNETSKERAERQKKEIERQKKAAKEAYEKLSPEEKRKRYKKNLMLTGVLTIISTGLIAVSNFFIILSVIGFAVLLCIWSDESKRRKKEEIKKVEKEPVRDFTLEKFTSTINNLLILSSFTFLGFLLMFPLNIESFLVLFVIPLVITILFYRYKYLPQKNKTSIEIRKKAYKSNLIERIVWGIILVLFPLFIFGVYWYNQYQESTLFKFDIKSGNYTKISNNLIETKVKSFDLNLHTNAIEKLSINGKNVEITDDISYPVKIKDDLTLNLSITKEDGTTMPWDIKIDFLTELDLIKKKKQAKEQAKKAKELAKEEAIRIKKELDKKREEKEKKQKREIQDTIATYEKEGMATWEDYKLVEIIKNGLASNNPEIKKLAGQLKRVAQNFQAKDFPKQRVAYGKEMRDKLWEDDFKVRVSGRSKDVITFINAYFVANRNIKEFHQKVSSDLHRLRFSRANYKWADTSYGEYTYYTIDSPLDTKIEGLD